MSRISKQELQKKMESALLHDNTFSPQDDRKFRGQAMREAIPHDKHAEWKAPDKRADPVSVLEKSNAGRLMELIPLRYGRMLHSPFTFYRGSAALMAQDLAGTPVMGVSVQACGDCHLMNFGAFATPERNIVFDINDFDETLPAPWEWDVKRLAVSFVLAARDNNLKEKFEREAAEAVTRGYREKIAKYADMPILDIWYDRVEWQSVIEKTSNEDLQKARKDHLKKAMKRTIKDFYVPKMTQQFDGHCLIKDTPPVVYHLPKEDGFHDKAVEALKSYRLTLQEDRQRLFDRYRLADIAIKVVGIGSVGTMCAVALLLARDNEPLLLQLKEARESVLEAYAGKSEFENHGQRVVAGQRISQSASDIFLGWTKLADGRHFYVRQLRDTKISLEPDVWDGNHMTEIAEVMGGVLARCHARTGDSSIIKGYLGNKGTFDEAIGEFSIEYANQMQKDFGQMLAAVEHGKIKVQTEDDDD